MKQRVFKPNVLFPAGLIAALAILPHFLPIYWMSIVIYTLWISYICVTWNILASSGTYSLMHMLFVGGGAYLSTFLFKHFGISPWLGMLGGAAMGAVLSVAIGYLCFRYNLPTFAFFVITMAFSFIGMFVVQSIKIFGGNEGMYIPIRSTDVWNFAFVGKLPYYYIILAMVIGAMVCAFLISRSKTGLYLRAIGAEPRVAAAMGVDVMGYKLRALAISAALSSLAGTFWAQYSGFIDPVSMLSPTTMMIVLLFVIVGGAGTTWGPLVATVILVPLGEYLRGKITGPSFAGISTMLWAVVILILIFSLKKGILPWIEERMRNRQRSARST